MSQEREHRISHSSTLSPLMIPSTYYHSGPGRSPLFGVMTAIKVVSVMEPLTERALPSANRTDMVEWGVLVCESEPVHVFLLG